MDLTPEEIQSLLSGLARGNDPADELLTVAEDILNSFREHEDGTIEITFNDGADIQEMGRCLNCIARDRGVKPVFYVNDSEIRKHDEKEVSILGRSRTYSFHISKSPEKVSAERLAPSAAVTLAEACCRIKSGNNRSLLSPVSSVVWIRCATPGTYVTSCRSVGVYLDEIPEGKTAKLQHVIREAVLVGKVTY